MRINYQYIYGLCAVIFLSFVVGDNQAYANERTAVCADEPQSKNALDCDTLRNAVLYSVRHKHQGVSLSVSGSQIEQSEQIRSANKIYKDFLHWTALRDRVTIGNLLTEGQRKNFNPTSHAVEGFTVMWLNIPSVNMNAYYDTFWAQRANAVVVTHRPATSSITAMRD